MKDLKDNVFTLVEEDGKEIDCKILFTCELDGYDHSYVVFEMLEKKEISAARYIEKAEGSGEILDIEDEKEWDQLEEILEQYEIEMEEHNVKTKDGKSE